MLVDDGSRDGTVAAAAAIARSDARVRLVVLARNSGQTAAMAAGMAHARGKYLVTMDGDLQNDPRDIPMLVDTLEDDYDLVAGWRMKRQDKLVTRKIPSRIANWLIGKITGIPIRDNGCSLKAYRASVMRHVPLYSEMHRFIPAMSSIAGARIVQVPVRHHARQFGAVEVRAIADLQGPARLDFDPARRRVCEPAARLVLQDGPRAGRARRARSSSAAS